MSVVARMGLAARFAVLVSLVIALALAVFMAAWSWIENPSGIFHNESGTNWKFVWDTGISWFLPTVIGLLPPAFLAHIGWQWLRTDDTQDP